ncbi:MAG: polysaccharide deacetylase family protein [Tannerella sp.]|nr:polysaccharide deacetylase family protein [Tannerella sp.]
MEEIITYLIQFMLGEQIPAETSRLIAYTSDRTQFHSYKIVIIPSGFFDANSYGKASSMPKLPVRQIDDIPFLFGEPRVEQQEDTLVVHADLVASAFFLLSRYEEIVRRDVRDIHGRFPGRESLPYRAGFIHRPIVDEYGQLLRKWLSLCGIQTKEPTGTIRHCYFTHDVDAPFAYRTWRNMARGLFREGKTLAYLLRTKFSVPENDPFYTFPWLLERDACARKRIGEEKSSIYLFFKAGGTAPQDKPGYDLRNKNIQDIHQLLTKYGGKTGLHSSYEAGKKPTLIPVEKKRLEEATGQEVTANRHHFLALREPEDMDTLEKSGITDDFTMGYADIAGFRLGTSRPVHWIDATSKRLSPLLLHPLTVMDNTLSESHYMGLSFDAAQEYCFRLTDAVKKANGELVLLWHNSSAMEGTGYHKMLYENLLSYIENG